MIRLYIKTLVATLLLIGLIVIGYYFGFSYFAQKRLHQINFQLSKGTFSYIQHNLHKLPQAEWASELKKLQPKGVKPAKIVPVASLQLSNVNKAKLIQGSIVFIEGRNHLFLDYGIDDSLALQRIGKSNYALQIALGEPINQIILGTIRWIAHINLYQLDKTPADSQHAMLVRLQSQFGIPLKLINSSDPVITPVMKADLKNYQMAYAKTKAAAPISTLYVPTSIPNKVLVIGPISYSPLSQRYATVEKYYFVIFAIAAIIIVFFLTWLFSRNTRKIYALTQKFSAGDFKSQSKINRLSTLYGVYRNIMTMGASLNRLIQSQQNMTRFVAHEVRTPLSTLQLAVDSMKKETDLSAQSQQNLVSIQEDINDINDLISHFLLYHQSASAGLKLKKEKRNLTEWLAALLSRYQLSEIQINFISHDQTVYARFDPKLLKHVIDNLITNALKFAKTTINVRIQASHDGILIEVDDDGPGISQSEREAIFEPFNTLGEGDKSCKHIGLGLAIAKSIIELHNGNLSVSTATELGGARFSIILPHE